MARATLHCIEKSSFGPLTPLTERHAEGRLRLSALACFSFSALLALSCAAHPQPAARPASTEIDLTAPGGAEAGLLPPREMPSADSNAAEPDNGDQPTEIDFPLTKLVRDRVPVPTADNPSLGPAHATVVIQIFSDFECPFCWRAHPTLK